MFLDKSNARPHESQGAHTQGGGGGRGDEAKTGAGGQAMPHPVPRVWVLRIHPGP